MRVALPFQKSLLSYTIDNEADNADELWSDFQFYKGCCYNGKAAASMTGNETSSYLVKAFILTNSLNDIQA